jgi:hypothetical protein
MLRGSIKEAKLPSVRSPTSCALDSEYAEITDIGDAEDAAEPLNPNSSKSSSTQNSLAELNPFFAQEISHAVPAAADDAAQAAAGSPVGCGGVTQTVSLPPLEVPLQWQPISLKPGSILHPSLWARRDLSAPSGFCYVVRHRSVNGYTKFPAIQF